FAAIGPELRAALTAGLTAAGLTCTRRSARLFAAIGPKLRAALTAGLTAAGLTCTRRSARLFAAIGPKRRAALTAGLTAAGLTCTRRSARLFAAIGPKRRAALTAGLTAAGLTYTRRSARFVDETGPKMRADLTNGLTAAEVNPALTAGNCLAYFHVTLPIKRLIARWTPPDYQSEDGRGYQPRPFQHSTAGTTPQTHRFATASDFRTGLRLLFALQTNRDKQLHGLRREALLIQSPSHSHRVTSPVSALGIPTLVQRY
ncbi:hypothetical protein, partial [Burkholderia pseudomallei]|uniref:hypothetical protein n=1 Tax=Burkholderia pseudomallei TaxID=28450 RepID=UPI0015C3D507